MEKNLKLSIIIPVFNEEKTISEIIKRVKKVKLKTRKIKFEKEIVVVNDGSQDQTPKILQEIGKKDYKIKVFTHLNNQGKGAALRTGFRKAAGDIIIIQDADLEYNPDDYPKLIKALIAGKFQVIYGTRMRLKTRPQFYLSLFGNKMLTWSTNFLFGSHLSDVFVGYKAFKKQALEGIELKSNGFEIEIELTAKFLKKGLKIKEVPISYQGRSWQEGKKITFKDGLIALWSVFKYKFKN